MWKKVLAVSGIMILLYGGLVWSQENKNNDSKTEIAIYKGLKWLARHQHKEGCWEAAQSSLTTGVTGLTLLSFLETGFTHNTKDDSGFNETVKKGLDYLLTKQTPDGGIDKTPGKSLYNHCLATYALARAYKDSGDKALKISVKKATEYLINAQNPGAAWRYQPRDGDNDASVTGWALCALNAAQEARITVSKEVFRQAFTYFNKVTDPQTGSTGYVAKGGRAMRQKDQTLDPVFHETLTASMIYHSILGAKKTKEDNLIQLGATLLLQDLPQWDTDKYGQIDYYYWFWGTRAMSIFDGPKGKDWKTWANAVQNALLPYKEEKWSSTDRWGDEGGKPYQFAINILTLLTCSGIKPSSKLPPPPVIKITPELEKEIKRLIEQLGNDNWQIREQATKKLIEIAEPAIKYLKESENHSDPEVQLRVKLILDEIE